jgi:hypothetical protein
MALLELSASQALIAGVFLLTVYQLSQLFPPVAQEMWRWLNHLWGRQENPCWGPLRRVYAAEPVIFECNPKTKDSPGYGVQYMP